MKTLVFGPTGMGKSFNYIMPAIESSENVILITSNGYKSELCCMNLPFETVKAVKSDDLDGLKGEENIGKLVLDIEIPDSEMSAYFEGVIIPTLESRGISNNTKNTVIIIGFYKALNDENVVHRLEKWDANVLLECTCSTFDIQQGEINYLVNSRKWGKAWVAQRISDIVPNRK